jgi:hypothetical protein
MNDYTMYNKMKRCMLKLLNKVSFIVKKTTTHSIIKKQIQSLVLASSVESPSCRTLAAERGDPRLISSYLFVFFNKGVAT